MQLSERQVSGVTVITAQGDLVVTDNPCVLKAFVKDALERGERQIVLNVARIRRMDSTCLGEIVGSYTSAKVAGGALKLAEPDAHLRRLLQITRLDTIIDVFDTEAEALASFAVAGSSAR